MGDGNINAPFPENLRDPVDGDPAAMRFQDLFFILPQGVDLGLFAVVPARIGSASDVSRR
jgi:hypothetical protein